MFMWLFYIVYIMCRDGLNYACRMQNTLVQFIFPFIFASKTTYKSTLNPLLNWQLYLPLDLKSYLNLVFTCTTYSSLKSTEYCLFQLFTFTILSPFLSIEFGFVSVYFWFCAQVTQICIFLRPISGPLF